MKQRLEDLEKALTDAIDYLQDWGSYVSDYFKEKHDFDGDVEALQAVLDGAPYTEEPLMTEDEKTELIANTLLRAQERMV